MTVRKVLKISNLDLFDDNALRSKLFHVEDGQHRVKVTTGKYAKRPSRFYWLAINGPSVADCPVPAANVEVAPTPEALLGFPSRKEQIETQKFLLNAPIPDCVTRLRSFLKRNDVKIIRPRNPEPPTKGATSWIF